MQGSENSQVNLPVFHVVPHLLVLELPTNQTLEGKDDVLRVHNCLSFSRQTNRTLAMLGKRDDGGRCPCSFRVLDNAGSFTLHDGDARIGRAQVNTDNRTYKIVNIPRKKSDTYVYLKLLSSCSSQLRNEAGPAALVRVSMRREVGI
jgi:hypothetical protein